MEKRPISYLLWLRGLWYLHCTLKTAIQQHRGLTAEKETNENTHDRVKVVGGIWFIQQIYGVCCWYWYWIEMITTTDDRQAVSWRKGWTVTCLRSAVAGWFTQAQGKGTQGIISEREWKNQGLERKAEEVGKHVWACEGFNGNKRWRSGVFHSSTGCKRKKLS